MDAFPDGVFDFTIKYTTCQGDAINIARDFAREHDLVICCGGDGTLNETINGLMSAGVSVPIGYLPMGSTNDLAATLGIPTKLKEAAELIASGHTNGYDVGDCNGHQFSYVACFGPGTKISYSTPQKMKNLLGYNAYMINGFFLHLIPALADVKPRHIKIEYDDGEYGGSTTQVDLKVLNRAVSIFSPENPMFLYKEEKEEATV